MSNILFFDTETTGIDPSNSSLIQLGAVHYIDGKKQSEFNMKCAPDPNKSISVGALAVNRQPASTITELPNPIIISSAFVDYILSLPKPKFGKIKLGGHNVQFDVGFVTSFLATNGYSGFTDIFDYRLIDTASISQFLIDADVLKCDRSSLSVVAKFLDVGYDENIHHDALYDAELTAKVYFKLIESIKNSKIVTDKRTSWI